MEGRNGYDDEYDSINGNKKIKEFLKSRKERMKKTRT